MRADSSTEITARPQPTELEIQFILDAIAEYLQVRGASTRIAGTMMGKPIVLQASGASVHNHIRGGAPCCSG